MAGFGSKKEISKRDMNFFAEFTAAAAKLTRMLTYGVIALVVVIAIIIAVVVYCIIRNAVISKQITDMQTLLSSEEYTSLDAEAANLAEALDQKNNYYYTLSQMRKQIDTTPSASVDLTDLLAKSIPSDTYIDAYEITGSQFVFSGYSFSYYSVVDMVNIINKSDVFSMPVQLNVSRVAANTVGSLEDFANNAIDNYYSFTITGQLTSEVYVSYTRYAQNGEVVSSLGAVTTEAKTAGQQYTIADIGAYEQNGVKYKLANVTIDGKGISADDLASIMSTGEFSNIATSNTEIQFYYVVDNAPAATEEAPAEGGNA